MYKWGLDALMVKLSSTILKEDDDDGAVDDNDDKNYKDKDCRKDHTDQDISIGQQSYDGELVEITTNVSLVIIGGTCWH